MFCAYVFFQKLFALVLKQLDTICVKSPDNKKYLDCEFSSSRAPVSSVAWIRLRCVISEVLGVSSASFMCSLSAGYGVSHHDYFGTKHVPVLNTSDLCPLFFFFNCETSQLRSS